MDDKNGRIEPFSPTLASGSTLSRRLCSMNDGAFDTANEIEGKTGPWFSTCSAARSRSACLAPRKKLCSSRWCLRWLLCWILFRSGSNRLVSRRGPLPSSFPIRNKRTSRRRRWWRTTRPTRTTWTDRRSLDPPRAPLSQLIATNFGSQQKELRRHAIAAQSLNWI